MKIDFESQILVIFDPTSAGKADKNIGPCLAQIRHGGPEHDHVGKIKVQLAVLKYVLNVWLCYQSKHIILVKKTDAQGPAVTCLYQ